MLSSFLPRLTCGASVARAVRTMLAVASMAVTALPTAHAASVSGQGDWQTTLHGRDLDGNAANGDEAYYDTALDITWLADANYAQTSGYDTDGRMSWDAAQTWVAQLNVNGFTGWRLPDVKPADGSSFDYNFSYGGSAGFGYNITSTQSELAHLYYVTLGNKGDYDASGNFQVDFGLQNSGPFSNVQPYYYWSDGSSLDRVDPNEAANFYTPSGLQNIAFKTSTFSAWAVHSGDVAAVPEPQTYALMALGLVAVLVARGRQHR